MQFDLCTKAKAACRSVNFFNSFEAYHFVGEVQWCKVYIILKGSLTFVGESGKISKQIQEKREKYVDFSQRENAF